MPAWSAVSTRPSPFGTCTVRSSIVTETSSGALTPRSPTACGWHCACHSRLAGTATFFATKACRFAVGRGSCGHPLLDDGVVRVLIYGSEQPVERRLAAEGAAALVHVRT